MLDKTMNDPIDELGREHEGCNNENALELWARWQEAGVQIVLTDEAAHKEAAGNSERYLRLSTERIAPFCDAQSAIEETVASYVPSTLDGVLLRLRILKMNSDVEWHELLDDILASATDGLEAIVAAGV